MDALSQSAARQLEHYGVLGGPISTFPPWPYLSRAVGMDRGTSRALSPADLFIFSPWNDLISAPCQGCYSPRSKANTTNNHFFKVLAMQGLTVEANVMVCEDDRSVPLGCAPHGDMNHSKSCLNVMFLQREKKEPQCYMCCLHREPYLRASSKGLIPTLTLLSYTQYSSSQNSLDSKGP